MKKQEYKENDNLNDNISRIYNKIINNNNEKITGASTIVIKNGEIVFNHSDGFRYLDFSDKTKNLPMTSDSYFRIASISKLFTAVSIMQLYENNKLDLDEDVSNYLGFKLRNPNFKNKVITLKMLMSHTSSLNDSNGYYFPLSETIEEFLSKNPKTFNNNQKLPGKYFNYCNLNYIILGIIIEKVAKERFDIYVKKHILKPMGLKASFNIYDFNNKLKTKLGTIYRKIDNKVVANMDNYYEENFKDSSYLDDYQLGTNTCVFAPQGGLRISTFELAQFMKMFLNYGKYKDVQILKKETVELMFTPYWKYNKELKNGDTYQGLMLCYGLGTHILTNTMYGDKLSKTRDLYYVGHHGDAYGLISLFLFDFKNKDGFINIINGVEFDHYNKEHYSDISVLRKPEQRIIDLIYDYIL